MDSTNLCIAYHHHRPWFRHKLRSKWWSPASHSIIQTPKTNSQGKLSHSQGVHFSQHHSGYGKFSALTIQFKWATSSRGTADGTSPESNNRQFISLANSFGYKVRHIPRNFMKFYSRIASTSSMYSWLATPEMTEPQLKCFHKTRRWPEPLNSVKFIGIFL